MKEPKNHKKEENEAKNKKYNFFEEGLFPEKEDIKKMKNRSSRKENKRPPFSVPNDLEQKKPPNTQNDDDLLPFFAKDYPSSSDSKEEICFINSPIPSQTSYNGGEAEEVEGIEEEDNEEKSQITNEKKENEKKENENFKNQNNEEIGQSIDFNSELEAEQEKPSNMITREEFLKSYNKQQEKNKEEERKKEEEEKKRKEEEEIKKEKEEEEKRNKEMKIKKEKIQQEKRKKIVEDEKRREKNEEDKRKKELEKKKKEDEKKRKMEIEKKRKDEEEKMKRFKSGKKNDPFHLMSSIKKYSDENSIGPSTSMINEVKQIFPGVIPEVNAENEEDNEYSKKNFKKSSKMKLQKEPSVKKENKEEEKKKTKSKNKGLKVTNFDEKLKKEKIQNKKKFQSEMEDDEETKETKMQKNKKKAPQSKKSNGISILNKSKKSKNNKSKRRNKFDDNDGKENFSNYGDELKGSDSDVPRKRKIIIKDSHRSKPKKKISSKQKYPTQKDDLVLLYLASENAKLFNYEVKKTKNKKGFGIDDRYSLRNRVKTLRHDLGEKPHYVDYGEGPELQSIDMVTNPNLGYTYINNEAKNEIIRERKKKKRRTLVKGAGIFDEEKEDSLFKISEDKNEKNNDNKEEEYNSELLDSQNFSEYGEDDARFLKIPKGGKKNLAKNYDTLLIIKVHEAQGKNMIKVDKREYKDLRNGDIVRVDKNQEYEILNFSNNNLIVQLLLDEEESEEN